MSGGTIPPPPGPGPFPGSVELDKNGAVVSQANKHRSRNGKQVQQPPRPPPPPQQQPPRTAPPPVVNGRKHQHLQHVYPHPKDPDFDDDELDEDEYDEDEYDEDEEEEEDEEEDDEDDEDELDDPGKKVDGQSPAVSRRAQAKLQRGKARDGLFNIGHSLTTTGEHPTALAIGRVNF
jgi:hypothetical protein